MGRPDAVGGPAGLSQFARTRPGRSGVSLALTRDQGRWATEGAVRRKVLRVVLELTAEEAAQGVVVARRPIVDRTGSSQGFELVYDATVPTSRRHLGADSGVVAVSQLLHSQGWSLEDLVDRQLAWCHVDHATFVADVPLMLPPAQTVLRVTRSVLDDRLVEACRRRRDEGFTVALSEFPADAPELLEVVDVVSIDVDITAASATLAALSRCQELGIRTLARGCRSGEELSWARQVGFDLFVGPAAATATPPERGELAPAQVSQVRLGIELLGDELDLDAVEDVLRVDPVLSAQVLSLAASGRAGGLRREVGSVREALVVLGTRRLQRWAALVVLGRQGTRDGDGLFAALLRARTSELLAPHRGLDPDAAFTAGLLSALDLVLGVPLASVTAQLDLPDSILASAFRGETPLGELVSEVRSYQVLVGSDAFEADEALSVAAAEAFLWAAGLTNALD